MRPNMTACVKLSLLSLLTVATASVATPSAYSGGVQLGTEVCGITYPFRQEHGILPRLWSPDGGKGVVYRIGRYRSITDNALRPGQGWHSAVADFLSALEIEGVEICLQGTVEIRENKADLARSIYVMYPKKFSIQEAPRNYLDVSSVIGTYWEPRAQARISVAGLNDREIGKKFVVPELPEIVKEALPDRCTGVDAAVKSPGLWLLRLVREDKLTLKGKLSVPCDFKNQTEPLSIEATFRRREPLPDSEANVAVTVTIKRGDFSVSSTLIRRNSASGDL